MPPELLKPELSFGWFALLPKWDVYSCEGISYIYMYVKITALGLSLSACSSSIFYGKIIHSAISECSK